MRKVISVALALVVLLSFNAYALDTILIDMRDKIFEESKQIKLLMEDSSDIIALNSMWSSCIVTMTQLGAYFFMVGIFNTIEEEDLDQDSIEYIIRWLDEVKKTNGQNLKALGSLSQQVDSRTQIHAGKLQMYYSELNNVIDAELKKISLIEQALKVR